MACEFKSHLPHQKEKVASAAFSFCSFPSSLVLSPAIIERYKAYAEYSGRPVDGLCFTFRDNRYTCKIKA